ncbi:hypothetical protein Tco_1011280, partial [Tanacetum coccineum]
MTARILENYNQGLILESSLDMHRAEKVTESTTSEPDKSWKLFMFNSRSIHVQSSPGPAPNLLTPGLISSGLVPNPAPILPYVPPTNKELEMLFQPMFDEYFNLPGNRQDP